MKFSSLILIIVLMLLVFCHYFFITSDTVFIILVTSQDFIISMIFLLICYLFCKNASKILPGRKKWLTFIKVVAVVTLIIDFFIYFVDISDKKNIYNSCKTWFYLELNFIKSFVSIFFIITCVIILNSLKKL